MKVAELLASRRNNWRELDDLCSQLEHRRSRNIGAANVARFAALYRSVCADLALAESYQLPPNTVAYLHRLVGRAHNQLYRSRRFNLQAWRRELFDEVPQRLFSDHYLWLCFVLFWGIFCLSMFLAAEIKLPWTDRAPFPGYAHQILPLEMIDQLEESFSVSPTDRGMNEGAAMAGFYIMHNTGIGLKCFSAGLIFGIGGLFATIFNAALLGAAFGYMMRSPNADNFFHFVTAHGPFELTAIVLSATAGMRLGFALVNTGGFSRLDSIRLAGKTAMPTMGAAIVLFGLAAFIEGFISPSPLPYAVKAGVSALSSVLLTFYFVVLGWPREELMPNTSEAAT